LIEITDVLTFGAEAKCDVSSYEAKSLLFALRMLIVIFLLWRIESLSTDTLMSGTAFFRISTSFRSGCAFWRFDSTYVSLKVSLMNECIVKVNKSLYLLTMRYSCVTPELGEG
jgi:hypothetical protein